MGCGSVCFTREDADAFSIALRAAIPGLRFVSRNYWKPFVDWKAYDETMNERRRREEAGLDPGPWRYTMRDPTGEPLQYWDSLGVPGEDSFYAWIVPDGWEPEWGEEGDFGERRIVNRPPRELMFRRSRFRCIDRNPRAETVDFADPPQPKNDLEAIQLECGDINVRAHRFDSDGEAFAKLVLRILYKCSIDRFMFIERSTRRALSSTSWRNRGDVVAGRSAEAWSLARRHNYLTTISGLGLLKPASYPFAPGDVFSPEELAAYEAKEKAELEEAIARERARANELSAQFRREAQRAIKSEQD